jgi:UDP-hydrolysing UDP-N-acetyl-D-glucosamine 2-epimerase
MQTSPLLEVVVTARPSWARVKNLVLKYGDVSGVDRVRLSLVGPAVSHRYGDIAKIVPKWLSVDLVPTLNESDSLDGIALSCVNGSTSLIQKWSRNRPECVLVIADRTETLGVSLAASIMQIPLIHLQGGEISGSIDDKIRDANTKLADFHLTTNSITAARLVDMGEREENIKIVGCPSIDLLLEENETSLGVNFKTSADLGGVGSNFSLSNSFGIIMFHPDTLNQDQNVEWAKQLINLSQKINLNWLWFWPNPDHGTHEISREIRRTREHTSLLNIRFIVNLEPELFVMLAKRSRVFVGNSSFGIREASFLGLPVINVGNRQSGRQRSSNVLDIPELIENEDFIAIVSSHLATKRFLSSNLYGSGDSGLRAAMAIKEWSPRIKSR